MSQGFTKDAVITGVGVANQVAYWSGVVALAGSSNLKFDGSDVLLGSGIRARMDGQNRFRYLNSMAHVSRTGAKSLSNNAWTVVDFDSEHFDTDTIHDTVTANSRLTAKLAGKYLVTAVVSFASNSTGERKFTIEQGSNGTQTNANIIGMSSTFASALGATFMAANALTVLAVNDYLEFFVFQNSGGNLNLEFPASYKSVTSFGMFYIGE
jgi:hypothetical protein